MKHTILIIMLAVAATAMAQKEPVNIGVIPTPQRVEMGQGYVELGKHPRRNFVDEIEGAQNQRQAYRIEIAPEGVTVWCVGNEGWGYALKTLDQLKKIYGDRVPCMTITDWPAYEFRGWLDDISRGPIPNRQFRRQTRSFSEQYKLNFGNYYTEHTLYNELYPDISGYSGLNSYEYSNDPFMMANLQCFAHFEKTLRIPYYQSIMDGPTNVNPATIAMTQEEKRVYHLIAIRFIAAFYPDCEFNTTTVMAQVGQYGFKATGKEILKPGWRDLYNKPGDKNGDDDSKEKSDDDNGVMPHFEQGESGPHEPSVLKRTTQPPKPYTEGTLLRAMETAGKTVDDEELRDAMKENGIGRPSTRAAIIETLFKRRYIRKERKSIAPTMAGIQLIDTINEPLLKSASLTGLWEKKLREIERGEYSAARFIDELKAMISEIVLNVLRDNTSGSIAVEQAKPVKPKAPTAGGEVKPKKPRAPRIKSIEEIPCPVCGKGHLMKGKTGYGCSEYKNGCHTVLPFTEYPADLTPARLATKVKKNFKGA
jgi:DNA topoisomerase-3